MAKDQRRIGCLTVSVAGLGCNNFGRRTDERETRAVVTAALDAGVTLFDTADIYGDGASEVLLGQALGRRRDEVVITTKFGGRPSSDGLSGGDPRRVRASCEDSLRRLGTDRIDLYLLHHPDPCTPVVETLRAMNDLIARGKVREIGCSNFSAVQLDEAAQAADREGLRRFICVQNELSLLQRGAEKEVLAACGRLGVGFVPFFPLAKGALSGKFRRDRPAPPSKRYAHAEGASAAEVLGEERLDVIERLRGFAEARGHSLLELALSWLASRPAVAAVIAGASSADQVRTNVAATTSWSLSAEDLAEVDRITTAAG